MSAQSLFTWEPIPLEDTEDTQALEGCEEHQAPRQLRWELYRTDEGFDYFYHAITGQSTWTLPDGLSQHELPVELLPPQESAMLRALSDDLLGHVLSFIDLIPYVFPEFFFQSVDNDGEF